MSRERRELEDPHEKKRESMNYDNRGKDAEERMWRKKIIHADHLRGMIVSAQQRQ